MSCKQAVITEVTSVQPDEVVDKAMDILEEKKIRTAPVLDADGKLLGMFGFHSILRGLLPVSVTMEHGLEGLEFAAGTAPEIAKKLKKLKGESVVKTMDTKPVTIDPSKSIWEGIRMLVKHGSPLPIVDKGGLFLGLITEQSAIAELEKSNKELVNRLKDELKDKK